MPRRRTKRTHEIYELERSPLAQKPTQRDVAELLGESRDNLRRLVNYKEQFVVRRQTTSRTGKDRDLAYPVGRLRTVHERLKHHLNKVTQPGYLFSPRKGRAPRDNAAHHVGQGHFLSLDVKQFYPSTTFAMVKHSLIDLFGLRDDVAGLIAHLATIDGKVAFGSPLTPVLCSLVHRRMFDAIAQECDARGLRCSLWVDDLTISGRFVPGELLDIIRGVIRASGLRSHKIEFRTGARTVFVTGVGVRGRELVAPGQMMARVARRRRALRRAGTPDAREAAAPALLSELGSLRYVVGPSSLTGQRAANAANAVRQKRAKWCRQALRNAERRAEPHEDDGVVPF